MIDPKYRFWAGGGATNHINDEFNVMDFDQRRYYSIRGPSSFLRMSDEERDGCDAIEVLKRYMDELDPAVHTLTVDASGNLISTSSDPDDDRQMAIFYPSLLDAPSLQECRMITMAKLTELNRLMPGVDLVSYEDEDGTTREVVFKNTPIVQYKERRWREIVMLHDLPTHPNIVPFDRIVVDDMMSQHILGFTVPYLPAPSLDKDHNQIFRLDWLHQLTSLVDYLNLELQTVNQDIAPRNLICLDQAPEGSQLRTFDFEYATAMGLPWHVEEFNDVKGVIFTLYEIITLDTSYRKVPPSEQDPDAVMKLEYWPQRRKLDSDVEDFRQHLREWVESRQAVTLSPATPTPFPEMPKPRSVRDESIYTGELIYHSVPWMSQMLARKLGNYVISWQRPPSAQMPAL
ncbi:unnamed protein product [Aureobasidium uvarum]|uniref:Protein kinase domain-containing protein n=1 Tax=Aureobasidium uvarum TaxID=2773716 RepID=A0A9N8KNU2_9PEZI|nr:unnamed protein product [Aureobasidium uvarum]